jgi:TonB family protein
MTHSLSPTEAKYLRIYETFPSLPSSLRKRGRIYTVGVQLCIAVDGRVARVVLEETAHQELDGAVLTAVHTWRYRPLLVRGVPSPFCHRVRIHYMVQ